MSHLEEIRGKLSIEELVGGYLQLHKAGRNLKGLCPFHHDSRPSFMVSPEKGIAWCFACNTGGDIFKFIQLMEKVEFPEAVRILAEKTNVALPAFRPQAQESRKRVLELNEMASGFFRAQLQQNPTQQAYFVDRGLSPQSIERFLLGFAPDSYQALKNHLIGKGASEKELLEAGLVSQRSIADKSTYDRFRNRLIFPLLDAQGHTVGFAGRVMDNSEPKYLNSPETEAYSKSLFLYGLNWAKESIKNQDLAIVVEGYMDAISAHQAGTPNTVAASGTALTSQQLKLLKRYTRHVAFAFDQDGAGLEAAKRAIELAKEEEMEISVIRLPEGKDPDECIRKSPEAWRKAIEDRVPVMDFYFGYAFGQHSAQSLEGRKAIAQLLLPLIRQLSGSMEQNHYLEKLAPLLKTDVKWLWQDMKRLPQAGGKARAAQTLPEASRQNFSREAFLIGFTLQQPKKYSIIREKLLLGLLEENGEAERFYKACETVYNRLCALEKEALTAEFSPEEAEKMEVYSLLVEAHYPDFTEEAAEQEMARLIQEINQGNIGRVQRSYIFRLKEAGSQEEKVLLLDEYGKILKLRRSLQLP